jgi:hypothetical protein
VSRADLGARARGVAIAIAIAGCGHRPATPGAAAAGDAILLIEAPVADAAVWVDGRFVAVVGALRGGVALAAGRHRIELRHDDYVSRYLEVTLAAREHRHVAVDLAPSLP